MKLNSIFATATVGAILSTSSNAAVMLSEFFGDVPGADPSENTIELSGGDALSTFDLWIVTIESDFSTGSGEGFVDRANNVTGTFDSEGLATVTVPDLENPSFTIILSEDFTGMTGVDLDPTDSGSLDVSDFTNILDVVGVIQDSGDPDYATALGGTYLNPFASTDPQIVFRDGSIGDWYYTAGSNVYDDSGSLVDPGLFSSDPTVTTFGSLNPALIPEPSTTLLGVLGALALFRRRRA